MEADDLTGLSSETGTIVRLTLFGAYSVYLYTGGLGVMVFRRPQSVQVGGIVGAKRHGRPDQIAATLVVGDREAPTVVIRSIWVGFDVVVGFRAV